MHPVVCPQVLVLFEQALDTHPLCASARGGCLALALKAQPKLEAPSWVYTHLGPGLWKPNWVGVGVACRVPSIAPAAASRPSKAAASGSTRSSPLLHSQVWLTSAGAAPNAHADTPSDVLRTGWHLDFRCHNFYGGYQPRCSMITLSPFSDLAPLHLDFNSSIA